ncbi:N-acetylmuramoyl-L-alanine amidase [Myxacorys almedinensis]|uniref:N-acetylmuramoyl-L-alanine amidase n=1 Tax=Myxacorys almedinensis A TaxID=2690445 RepID=A0A8J7YWG1_9CYAN|nr:N-acetylmuramoyl-L-alanine amidase [Myxacorys almedinensis]NDJ15892.1 N-acetylmuramoyl-L-alanine amidase [Myxacorys almedinensis A]
MKRVLGSVVVAIAMTVIIVTSAWANPSLTIIYPPIDHETTAKQIFLIGTAPLKGDVLVNGTAISRSTAGHFAPSFPLKVGANPFTVRYADQEVKLTVTRASMEPVAPQGATFGQDSLTPATDIVRLPGELICFSAIAPPKALVSVKLGDRIIALQRQSAIANLPANSGVLTGLTQPTTTDPGQYAGCTTAEAAGELGQPEYLLNFNGASFAQAAPGKIKVLAPTQLEVVEVTVDQGTARTGASTDYSRLTPLPKGTRATVTGREGDWLRLDYGGWVRASETKVIPGSVPVKSLIRGITSRVAGNWTEVLFPLQAPVPVSVQQENSVFNLTLYNTTAQTDTIRLVNEPVIARLDWQQTDPMKVQYRISLKNEQQWGYKLRYEGTTLVLSLRHPPKPQRSQGRSPTALNGIKILLDPGHGGPDDQGSRGPTGYPEKSVNLLTSQLLRQELVKRGATVVMTRTTDVDLDLPPRVAAIAKAEPAIALSIHYNALPDDGDAINTQGVAAFWYQTQAQSLAEFMHDYLIKTLNRPSYGVFWNNLALTRPTVTPSVLLELGFMINPDEFEWIRDRKEQEKLALTLADGITEWFRQVQ